MMKVRVEHRFWQREYAVFVYRLIDEEHVEVQKPDGHYERVHPGANYDLPPTFAIPEHLAQQLIEALQGVGVQPKQLTLIEGKYEAQSAHLHDLQNILRKQGYMA